FRSETGLNWPVTVSGGARSGGHASAAMETGLNWPVTEVASCINRQPCLDRYLVGCPYCPLDPHVALRNLPRVACLLGVPRSRAWVAGWWMELSRYERRSLLDYSSMRVTGSGTSTPADLGSGRRVAPAAAMTPKPATARRDTASCPSTMRGARAGCSIS